MEISVISFIGLHSQSSNIIKDRVEKKKLEKFCPEVASLIFHNDVIQLPS